MGDVRFEAKLDALRHARDRWGAIRAMSDDDLAQGLAAVSPEKEPYLANVIATELSNRIARKDAILETMPDGVLLVDTRGTLLYVNAAAREILSLDPSVALPTSLPATGVVYDAVARTIRSEAPVDVDAGEIEPPEGEPRFVALTARPVRREGDLVGVTVAIQDVTARREAEELLRQRRLEETERRYRRIFDERIEDLFAEHLDPPSSRRPPERLA